jgi:hypothetical protein
MLTIVTPVQSATKAIGVSILDVISNRLAFERQFDPLSWDGHRRSDAKSIEEEYMKSPWDKIFIHQCRLRACLYNAQGALVVPPAYSHDISNSRNEVRSTFMYLFNCSPAGYQIFSKKSKIPKNSKKIQKNPQ